LTGVQVSDHSTVILSGFKVGDSLQLAATDFGTLRGAVEAEDVRVEVSNHGNLTLTGSATQVMGEVLKFGSADLTGLDAAEVDIEKDTHSTLNQ
jgi:hypothetical protein